MRRLLLACLLFPAIATAQSFDVRVVDLDLAELPDGGTMELPFPEALMFRVRMVNVVPGLAYTFTAPRESIEKAPRSLAETVPTTEPCSAIIRGLKNDLSRVTSEVDVRSLVREARARGEREPRKCWCSLAGLPPG